MQPLKHLIREKEEEFYRGKTGFSHEGKNAD
jgi:hypothetical protein